MRYEISNTTSGQILGIYQGKNTHDALDSFALDAGYQSYADLLHNVPGSSAGELTIHELEDHE